MVIIQLWRMHLRLDLSRSRHVSPVFPSLNLPSAPKLTLAIPCAALKEPAFQRASSTSVFDTHWHKSRHLKFSTVKFIELRHDILPNESIIVCMRGLKLVVLEYLRGKTGRKYVGKIGIVRVRGGKSGFLEFRARFRKLRAEFRLYPIVGRLTE